MVGQLGTKLYGKIDIFLTRHLSGAGITYQQVFSIILPILFDQALIIIMELLNTAMVSSSGVAAVSAVSLVDSLNVFLMEFFIAVATGGTVVVAQCLGGKNKQLASNATSGVIIVSGVSAVLLSIFFIIFHQGIIFLLFGTAEPDVLDHARTYFIACCLSYPCYALYQGICGALKGAAQTKSSLLLSLITNVSYLFFNIIFILIFDMGILGLSIALNLSRVLGAVCSFLLLVRHSGVLNFKMRNLFRSNFYIIKKILFIGVPFAAEQIFFNGGKIVTQMFVVQLGTLAMATLAISNSITWVFEIGGSALSLAVVTVVGYCMGQNNISDARKFIRSFIVMGSLAFIMIEIISLPFLPFIISLFSPPNEIIATLYMMISFVGIGQPLFWSISFITPSALRAAGDAKFTSIISMLTMWTLRVVIGYLLSIQLGIGIIGVSIAMVTEWVVRGAVFLWRFKGNRWCRFKLID